VSAGISVIIPALNEAANLPEILRPLAPWSERGHEIIVVDGGSDDNTARIAEDAGVRVVRSERGRARQMNAGVLQASRDVFLFLHADTQLPVDADVLIRKGLKTGRYQWGRFDVHIHGTSRMFPVISFMINWRSRLSGIATGDQALFMTRTAYQAVGGFPNLPLMEDVEICKRLQSVSRPLCLRARVSTSGRRWEKRGVWRTIVLMWRLRYAYWRGTPAEKLALLYR
jgi:rSAM/selenodomain-associated transferase 2